MERSRRLDDDVLAEEIELYGDLVVAATAADGALPQAAIDRLLGLADDDSADPSDDGPDDSADGRSDDRAGDADRPGGGAPGSAGAAGSGA